MSDPKGVFDPSPWAQQWASERQLCATLIGGTGPMRAAGAAHLPKFHQEDPNDHAGRIGRAVLDPYLRRAVGNLVGKVMAKPVRLEADAPEEIRGRPAQDGTPAVEGWQERIEGPGKPANLHEFLKRWLWHRLAEGGAAVLVDHPPAPDPPPKSRKGEAGLRPYAVMIPAANILGVDLEEIDGQETLTRFRYLECFQVPDRWMSKEVQQVRVLYRRNPEDASSQHVWRELYRRNEKGEEYLVTAGRDAPRELPPLTSIPVTPFPDWGKWRPPMIDLAYLNESDWQISSDNREYFQYVKRPAWTLFGFTESEITKFKSIGGRYIVYSEKPAGQVAAAVLETTGAAVQVAMKDHDDLKQQMEVESLRPLLKDATQTLGEKRLDAAEAASWLQSEALGLKNAGEEVLAHFAAWAKLPSGGSIKVNEDFGLSAVEQASLDALLRARAGVNGVPDISRRTLQEGLVLHRALPEEFDPEEEEARLAQESDGASAELADLRAQIEELAARVERKPAAAGAPPAESADLPVVPGGDVQKTALNGAQIASLVDVVAKVSNGEIPRESGIEILTAALPITRPDAEKIIGAAGTPRFKPEEPPAPGDARSAGA